MRSVKYFSKTHTVRMKMQKTYNLTNTSGENNFWVKSSEETDYTQSLNLRRDIYVIYFFLEKISVLLFLLKLNLMLGSFGKYMFDNYSKKDLLFFERFIATIRHILFVFNTIQKILENWFKYIFVKTSED